MPQADAQFYSTLFSASKDNAGDSGARMSSTITERASRKRLLSLPTSNTYPESNTSTVKIREDDARLSSAKKRCTSCKRLLSLAAANTKN